MKQIILSSTLFIAFVACNAVEKDVISEESFLQDSTVTVTASFTTMEASMKKKRGSYGGAKSILAELNLTKDPAKAIKAIKKKFAKECKALRKEGHKDSKKGCKKCVSKKARANIMEVERTHASRNCCGSERRPKKTIP